MTIARFCQRVYGEDGSSQIETHLSDAGSAQPYVHGLVGACVGPVVSSLTERAALSLLPYTLQPKTSYVAKP